MRKRSRFRKIHYTVGNDLDLWYCTSTKKWVEDLAGKSGSNSKRFRTKRKAFKYAVAMGKGFYVTQFIPTSGGWNIREWEVT